jgi:hypothetical protein
MISSCLQREPQCWPGQRRARSVALLPRHERSLTGERFDVVVLCHSLQEPIVAELVAFARTHWPEARTMLVTSTVYHDRSYSGIKLDAMSSSDPKAVLEHALKLLGDPAEVGPIGDN